MERWVVLGAGLIMLFCASLAVRELACSSSQMAERTVHERPLSAEQARSTELAPIEKADEPMPEAPPPAPAAQPIADNVAPAPHVKAPPVPPTGHFDAMQRAFEAEPRVEPWAGEREARIPELLSEAGFAPDAFERDASCRRTLCRFSLRVTDQSEDDMFSLMKLASAVQTSQGLSLAYGAAEAVGDKLRIVVLIPSEDTSLGTSD